MDLGTGTGSQSAAVFWYLDGQALDWLGQTGPGRGVRVTERRGRQLISTLIIENADMHHAGKFTCAPSYAKPDTVTLHVIDGKSKTVDLPKMLGPNKSALEAIEAIFSFFTGTVCHRSIFCPKTSKMVNFIFIFKIDYFRR